MDIADLKEIIEKYRVYTQAIGRSPDAFKSLLNLTAFLDELYKGIPLKQRCWHIIHDNMRPQFCECGELMKWTEKDGYVPCHNK